MKTRVRSHRRRNVLLFLAILAAYSAWCLLRPLPDLKPQVANSVISVKAPASTLVWPNSQAAVSIVGSDIIETKNGNKPVPTASTAKVITALMVLKQKPLSLNQQGPMITLTDKDVAIYKDYVSRDGSVVPVLAGEQISQYQALQTVMLPSANNMADSLAIWAYGSLPAYAAAANSYLKAQGLTGTHIGADASGLAADSVSTAADLAKIGALAMQNPVLAQIAGQSTATGIPVAGTIKNVNDLIGINNIIGLKTGNSNEAGGAFISASTTKQNNKTIVITTAVVNAPSLFQSMKDSIPLLKSAQTNFTQNSIVKVNQTLGTYNLPWGGSVTAKAANAMSVFEWNGQTTKANIILDNIPVNSSSGNSAGRVALNKTPIYDTKSMPIILASTPTQPPIKWRLTHPF